MAGSGFNIPHRNSSSQMEDSDSDYEKENIRPRGLTGLQNLGNTCYLNSALQSLSNCPPLTQYFLDCESLIRSEKSPMLSKSYLKLITELWHKKRPSYVVPSGIVSGIKAVHPMFRGFTQQDAQEFLRCLMDQLHEELKLPVVVSDDSDDEDESDDGIIEDNINNTNNANSKQQNDSIDGANLKQKGPSVDQGTRRPSFDSTSSQEEDYETCDSGMSSESSSNSGRDVSSGDENGSEEGVGEEVKRSRKSSALSAGSGTEEFYTPALDMVANTKEMKETANLLEKETENRRGKVFMEGGDSKDQGQGYPVEISTTPITATSPVPKEGELHTEMKPNSPTVNTNRKPRKPQNVRYDSIISQTFDGKILSSVRCLNCETVSTTKETFQDLSLPIPSKDHLHMLHSGYPSMTGGGVSPPKGGACGEVNQGWLASVLSWMKSWFVGPTVTLQDCLAAFFSADELKGDNMYSCGKCKKLRNGLKYSKVLELPEILSIHLKRFRHEFYSSKINTYISFPMEGLNMDAYADKDCRNEVTTYDLVAIICHHGTAGGGHYTAYCLNHLNGQWYEFDDQYVTEVEVSQVQNCEAYVLFYRKSNKKIEAIRQKIYEMETDERASILKFYISRPWLSRFQTFAEPGPITNMDFLCKHGGVPPTKVPLLDNLIAEIPQDTWEILYNRFGGGMVCNHLFACKVCQNEAQRVKQRQKAEREVFIKLNAEFQDDEYSGSVFAISMKWFRQWEGFARERFDTIPDAIDNSSIAVYRNGQPTLRHSSDHGHLSKDMWQFLLKMYGGGPEVLFRHSTGAVMKTNNAATIISSGAPTATNQYQQQQQNKPTLVSIAATASSSLSSASSSSASPTTPSSSPLSASSVCPQAMSSSSTALSQIPSSPMPYPTSSASTPSNTVSSLTISPSPSSPTTSSVKTEQPAATQPDNSLCVHTSSCHSHQKQLSIRPMEIHLKTDSLDMTITDNECNNRSPTTPSIDRLTDSLQCKDTNQQNTSLSEDINDKKINSEQRSHQNYPPTLEKTKESNDDNNEYGNMNNTVKSPLVTSEKQDFSTSSLNESLQLSTAQEDSKSISSTMMTLTAANTAMCNGTNNVKYQNRLSQDSGISSETSPVLEIVDNASISEQEEESQVVDSLKTKSDGKICPVNGRGMDGLTKDCAIAEAVEGEGDDSCVLNNAGGDSNSVTVVVNASNKPAGGKGKNRKKKNKNMEVTRI